MRLSSFSQPLTSDGPENEFPTSTSWSTLSVSSNAGILFCMKLHFATVMFPVADRSAARSYPVKVQSATLIPYGPTLADATEYFPPLKVTPVKRSEDVLW